MFNSRQQIPVSIVPPNMEAPLDGIIWVWGGDCTPPKGYGGSGALPEQQHSGGLRLRCLYVSVLYMRSSLLRPLQVCNSLAEDARRDKVRQTPDSLFRYLVERVRSNLHVILCMSPVGELFRWVLLCLTSSQGGSSTSGPLGFSGQEANPPVSSAGQLHLHRLVL